MSIHDFYSKLVSMTEENSLVEKLRRLSLLDDPKCMFGGESAFEWAIWQDGSGALAAQA